MAPSSRKRKRAAGAVRRTTPNAANGAVPPGWTAELWADELRRKADRCRAEHAETAAMYEGWAESIMSQKCGEDQNVRASHILVENHGDYASQLLCENQATTASHQTL
ncbi:hypothetical protein LCGC14_1327340 [marine sediment metagenome]|uniref:Uncharacterized protein n=1 Tax=marine sediment metagenome TaxID=412755 RepID=A0A0F9KI76_9ZZZZ